MIESTLLVLIAHGSRDPRWRKPFESLISELKTRGDNQQPITLCYMEMAEPGLLKAVKNALHETPTLTTVKILPLFMAAGAHFAKDIKALTEQLREAHPHLTVITHPPIGEDDAMRALIKLLAEEAITREIASAY